MRGARSKSVQMESSLETGVPVDRGERQGNKEGSGVGVAWVRIKECARKDPRRVSGFGEPHELWPGKP